MKVLVVDDNKEGRLMLLKLLTSNNYEVKEACNGIEALESLKTSKPDLIISDILMPEMDGFTLIRELNKDISGGKIPVVLYSAQYVNEKDKQLAEKLGASRFITKPTEPKDILELIKTVLAEFESTKEKQVKPASSKKEEYLGEYAERVFMKLEDKVRELEQEITERKQVETKLKESMESYRSLFDNSPISLWEEDFSEVKKYIDGLKNKGIKDFRIYFQDHPEEVANCAKMSKITDVNRATLQLYEAANKEELLAGLGKVLGEGSYKVFREGMIALAHGNVFYESEAINYTLSGRKINIILKWSVVPGYERSLSKVLVSILDITQRKSVEESLKLSEEKYRDLFENANDAICILDADLQFKDINIKTLKLTGYSKEEILKMSIFDLIPPEQATRSKEEFKKLRKKGHYEKFIGKMVTKYGNMIDVEVNSSAIIEDGRITGSRDILRDITERKKAEMALKESEARLREAQRVAHIGNWEWKPNTNELYWSDENFHIFGLNPDISPSLDTFFNIIHPDDLESVKKNIDDALNKIKSYNLDIRIIKPDGSQGYIHAMGEVDFDQQGNPFRMYGTVQDVTESKKVEEDLLMFKLGIERSSEAIFITHIDGKIIYINPSFEKIYGYNKEEVLGKKPNILKSGLLPPEAYKSYWDTLLAKKVVSGELINKTRDGRFLNIESSANPILNNEGNIIGFLAIQRNITQRRRAEKALRESEGRLQSILDNSSTVVFLKDLEGRYITVNRRYEELFHVTRETVVGKSDHDIFPKEHADRFRQHDLLALEKGGPFEIEEFVPHDDGLHVYISVKFPLFNAEKKPYAVCGIATDITERKRTEAAIRVSEERLHQAVRVSKLGFFDHDHRTDTIYWSSEQRRIYGLGPEEPITLPAFLKFVYPQDRERIAQAVRRAHDPAGDGSFDVEHRIVDRNGSIHWLSTRSRTQFEGEGNSRHPVRTVGAVADITERKIAEEKIEATLQENEILLREIHHRVKNNMQIISSLLGLASETIKDKKYVDMFRESQNRINSMSLIHEKLYRSRDHAKIELKDYIRDLAHALFQSRGVKKGTILLNLNIENVPLGIDLSIPLGLIINELITNSLKYAFPEDRKGEIKVSFHLIDENTFELIVSDNGVGIPYDMDFRKTESLGLRLVTLLAENQLKGNIDLDRSKGTEFNIKFRGR